MNFNFIEYHLIINSVFILDVNIYHNKNNYNNFKRKCLIIYRGIRMDNKTGNC